MCSWTRRNARHTIASVTPHLLPATQVLAAVHSMIRSRFSGRFSAEAALAAEFLRHFSAAAARGPRIGDGDRICATTWKSSWKKRLLERRNRLKSRNSMHAINAGAAARNPARKRPGVPPAAVAGKLSGHGDFFTFP